MTGIGSPLCLSHALSPLVEGVRMLMGKKGKPAGRSLEQAPLAGSPSALWPEGTERRQRCCGALGFRQRCKSRLACQVGRFGFAHSRRAYRRAERRAKVDLTNAILKQVIR
jgi:hypothetical protein